jgi:hypothetical protein
VLSRAGDNLGSKTRINFTFHTTVDVSTSRVQLAEETVRNLPVRTGWGAFHIRETEAVALFSLCWAIAVMATDLLWATLRLSTSTASEPRDPMAEEARR